MGNFIILPGSFLRQKTLNFIKGASPKTLTKAQIVESISSQIGFTKRQSVETVETLLEIIKNILESGDDVLISGFGKFCVKDKRERRGRNSIAAGALLLELKDIQLSKVRSVIILTPVTMTT